MKRSHESAILDRPRWQRILVRTTNWLGDTVLTLPAVQRLHELLPNSRISVLCHAKLADIWRHNPFVQEVIPFDLQPSIQQLRQHHFDLAIILPNSFRAAWECYRARIPTRVGFAGHNRRWLLTDIVAETRDDQPVLRTVNLAGREFTTKSYANPRHQAHRYLDLVSYLGAHRDLVQPKIWIAPGEIPSLTKFLHEDSRPFCGINPGAEFGSAKRWLPARFAEAAARIADEYPCHWLIFGAPTDVEIAGQIEAVLRERNVDVINLAGRTSLLELCELIKFCRLLLTNDTGPMHLAYALGTPLVAVFGSTSPELTGPLGPNAAVVRATVECSPCFLRECPIDFRCMNQVTTDQVVEAALKLVKPLAVH
jgi:heptosyltransferase-2